MSADFFAAARAAYAETDPAAKCAAVAALPPVQAALAVVNVATGAPGRPPRPDLVHPSAVPRRGLGSQAGRAALVHAVAHIEFNAINLALDAALRFPDLPQAYYSDWRSVAIDEARHFEMLVGRLGALDHSYGDLPAHNGLWEAAEKTAHDVLARMACVPRVLEARGLDVTPGMIARLDRAGDAATVAVLRVILDEEVRHVAIGSHWFRYLCTQRQLAPEPTFATLLREHAMKLRPPFNIPARRTAGFSREELDALGA